MSKRKGPGRPGFVEGSTEILHTKESKLALRRLVKATGKSASELGRKALVDLAERELGSKE